jgi:hypothetical protein
MKNFARSSALRQLRHAFQEGRLSLFLGAGCSEASGVPTWETLVTELYMNGLSRRLRRHQRVPEMVPSVATWAFRREVVPLEVAARGLHTYYPNDDDFVTVLRIMLYDRTGMYNRSRPVPREIRKLLARNKTLRSIAQLCRHSVPGRRGVRSVITYNYDDLLEWMLGHNRCLAVWKAAPLKPHKLPIYHVHGFVPFVEKKGSRFDEIVLSEDQYHREAQDPYSWNNLVQMQALSESVVLMIGLSLTDWNLRRVLDNLRALPRRNQSYALIKRPKPWKVEDKEVDAILAEMKQRTRVGFYFAHPQERLEILERPTIPWRIRSMIRDVEILDSKRQEAILADLGVTVIWYENHDDIAEIVKSLVGSVGL